MVRIMERIPLFLKPLSGSKIFCFEPDPRLTSSLSDKYKRFQNIIFEPKAIYKKEAEVDFFLAPSFDDSIFKNTGSSSLLNYTKESGQSFEQKVRVSATTLKQYDSPGEQTYKFNLD